MRRFHLVFYCVAPSRVFSFLQASRGRQRIQYALSLKKMELEQKYGITNLECFPFIINIGSNSDQAERVRQCQVTGVTTLASALKEVPNTGLRIVGISSRFLRSGGFHALLVPWNATKDDLIRVLQDTPSAGGAETIYREGPSN